MSFLGHSELKHLHTTAYANLFSPDMRQSAEEPLLQLGLQAGQRELLRVQQIPRAVEAHLHLQLLAAGLL